MPAYKAIGQVGLGGFLYATTVKLISKFMNHAETGTPVPALPVRYTHGDSASPSSWALAETELLTSSISQNVTATVTPPSTPFPSWTMILSLWSFLQAIVEFVTEQCGELIAELAVQLLFFMVMAYFGNRVDQWLMRVFGHPELTTSHHVVEEAPADSSYVWITKATIQLLHTLAARIQDRIDNLEAALTRASQVITDLYAELRGLSTKHDDALRDSQMRLKEAGEQSDRLAAYLSGATGKLTELEAQVKFLESDRGKPADDDALKESQTKLKEALEHSDRLDMKFIEATGKISELEAQVELMEKNRSTMLAFSKQTIRDFEAAQAKLSRKHDDALKDSEKKLKDALQQFDELDKKLRESTGKITELEAHLKTVESDRSKSVDDGNTVTGEDAKSIQQLEVKVKYWQGQLEQTKAETDQKIEKAVASAKRNADKAAVRRQELANVGAGDEIEKLKKALQKKEGELSLAKKQSADKITALKEALAKKEEDSKPASSFNPAATAFSPSPTTSSHSAQPSAPHDLIPATQLSPSLSAASFSPSPSPNPTLYQQTPIKREPMPEHARQNLDKINRELREKKERQMMGKSADDAEPAPLSEEELERRTDELVGRWIPPLQEYTPASPTPTPTPSVPSPTRPPTGPSTPTPTLTNRPHRGLKLGAPGTPPPSWPSAPPPTVEGAPTGPRAMRENGGRPPGIPPPPVLRGNPNPAPRGNSSARGRGDGGRGRGNGRGNGRARPELPEHLKEMLRKEAEERERREGGGV